MILYDFVTPLRPSVSLYMAISCPMYYRHVLRPQSDMQQTAAVVRSVLRDDRQWMQLPNTSYLCTVPLGLAWTRVATPLGAFVARRISLASEYLR